MGEKKGVSGLLFNMCWTYKWTCWFMVKVCRKPHRDFFFVNFPALYTQTRECDKIFLITQRLFQTMWTFHFLRFVHFYEHSAEAFCVLASSPVPTLVSASKCSICSQLQNTQESKLLFLLISLWQLSACKLYLYPGRYWMLRTQNQNEREREMRLLPPNSVLYLSFR